METRKGIGNAYDRQAIARHYRELDQSECMQTFYSKAQGLRNPKPFSHTQRAVILKFLSTRGVGPDQWLGEVREEKRNPERELNQYLRELASNPELGDYSLQSMKTSLLRFCKVMKGEAPLLGDVELENVNNPKLKRVITPYSKDDIIRLVNSAKSNRDRLIVLLASTTGIRVGTLSKLELGDVEEVIIRKEGEPYAVKLRKEITKTGLPYYTFTNEETAQSLRTYILSRGIKGPKDRIFSCHKSDLQRIFRRLVKEANLEGERTFHALRKYCRTTLVSANIPEAFIEAILGHGSTSIAQTYTKPPIEELRGQYKKALPLFSIYGASKPVVLEQEEIRRQVLGVLESLGIVLDASTLDSNPIKLGVKGGLGSE